MNQSQRSHNTKILIIDRIQCQRSMRHYLMSQAHLVQGKVSVSYHKDDWQFSRPILGAEGPQGLLYTQIPNQDFRQRARSGLKPGKFPIIDQVFNQLPKASPFEYSHYAEWRNLMTLWQKGLDSRDWVIGSWHVQSQNIFFSNPEPQSKLWLDQLYFTAIV